MKVLCTVDLLMLPELAVIKLNSSTLSRARIWSVCFFSTIRQSACWIVISDRSFNCTSQLDQ